MKFHQRGDAVIIDMEELLVVVPRKVFGPLFMDEDLLREKSFEYVLEFGNYARSSGNRKGLVGTVFEVGGYQTFLTERQRSAVRIHPGTGFTAIFRFGAGDRSWGDWENRRPVTTDKGDEVFAWAVPTTRGGGHWFEVQIFPSDAKLISAEEDALNSELLLDMAPV